MNFNNLKVASRLAWGFGSLLVLMIAIVFIGLSRMNDINDLLDGAVNNRIPKLQKLQDISFRAAENARVVRDLLLTESDADNVAAKNAYEKNTDANAADFEYLEKNLKQPKSIAMLHEITVARTAYRAYTSDVFALGMQNKNEEASKILYGERFQTQTAYFSAIKKLLDYQKEQAENEAALAHLEYASARNLMVGAGVIACVMGIALAIVITRGISGQLGGEPSEAAAAAHAVAQGDLSTPIALKHGDTSSLMYQLKAMQDSLAKVVAQVRDSSESVSTASAEIAAGNHDLSARTEQQASALEETAASMEELSSTVKLNAENAQQANQLAKNASNVATQGGGVVNQVVETMKGINESSRKIADIISVIDGIAFQTNILALNAAVEAARAGEQGRGFAVVATEVRSLAGRSADAAKEIKGLIAASVERVEHGSALVDQAGATMGDVVAAIQRVTDIMGEISAASSEQSSGVAQIGEAVQQMDQVTQQNAALVEEMAAAASSLKSQAGDLVQSVGTFKLSRSHERGIPVQTGQFNAALPAATIKAVSKSIPTKAALVSTNPSGLGLIESKLALVNGGDDWASF